MNKHTHIGQIIETSEVTGKYYFELAHHYGADRGPLRCRMRSIEQAYNCTVAPGSDNDNPTD